ncbi:MAG: hypothetical protein CMH30_06220 [Micavibrio sp.]|nr:hypothetical protein [Micavibrio sp.]
MFKSKPFIVTLTGDLGSGKSSLSKLLCASLKAEYYSTGFAQRAIADKMGISTLELNKLADTDSSIDDKIDGVFKDLAQTKTNLVVDSRMAWHFLPRSFKIRLKVNPFIAAERVMKDDKRQSEAYDSVEQAVDMIEQRKKSERERFLRYYNVDIYDDSNYDLIIDTSGKTMDQVFKKVLAAIEEARQPLWTKLLKRK